MTSQRFQRSGQHSIVLQGPMGSLEALTTFPAILQSKVVAIICHPHPLYQGTMHNKVVTTLAKAYDLCGMATVRFNYRGVGQSEGEYGEVKGEIEDCLAVYQWVQAALPNFDIALAGFSFGSFIAASIANQLVAQHLISVAPAVNHASYETLLNVQCPWLIIQGEADEVVPVDEVLAWESQLTIQHAFELMPSVNHFFHGRLVELRERVVAFLNALTLQ